MMSTLVLFQEVETPLFTIKFGVVMSNIFV